MAFGLLQFLLTVGGDAEGVDAAPIGLSQLLRQYGLPQGPQQQRALHAALEAAPQLWAARPLDVQALECAGGQDTWGWGGASACMGCV